MSSEESAGEMEHSGDIDLTMNAPSAALYNQPALFIRGGLYHARISSPHAAECIEITLHGITSDEQARAAATVFSGSLADPAQTFGS